MEDDDEDERIPDEQRLLNEIFTSNHYDESVRPVFNSSENVRVTFGFTLIQIMDMVSKHSFICRYIYYHWLLSEFRRNGERKACFTNAYFNKGNVNQPSLFLEMF